MLINIKMPTITIVGILTFMSMINFSCMTSVPGLVISDWGPYYQEIN